MTMNKRGSNRPKKQKFILLRICIILTLLLNSVCSISADEVNLGNVKVRYDVANNYSVRTVTPTNKVYLKIINDAEGEKAAIQIFFEDVRMIQDSTYPFPSTLQKLALTKKQVSIGDLWQLYKERNHLALFTNSQYSLGIYESKEVVDKTFGEKLVSFSLADKDVVSTPLILEYRFLTSEGLLHIVFSYYGNQLLSELGQYGEIDRNGLSITDQSSLVNFYSDVKNKSKNIPERLLEFFNDTEDFMNSLDFIDSDYDKWFKDNIKRDDLLNYEEQS